MSPSIVCNRRSRRDSDTQDSTPRTGWFWFHFHQKQRLFSSSPFTARIVPAHVPAMATAAGHESGFAAAVRAQTQQVRFALFIQRQACLNRRSEPPEPLSRQRVGSQEPSFHNYNEVDTYVPGDIMDTEVPYRPVPAGNGVRVPYTSRPLLTPLHHGHVRESVREKVESERKPILQRGRGLQHRRSFTEQLVENVLAQEGLAKYAHGPVRF